MINYQELSRFLSENISHIMKDIQKEAAQIKSPILKQYNSMLQEAQDSIAAMHLEAQEEYFHLFNAITDVIAKMDAEGSTLIGKKYMLMLIDLQKDAEELYLQQED